jgi:hypothetical protein
MDDVPAVPRWKRNRQKFGDRDRLASVRSGRGGMPGMMNTILTWD